MTCLGLLCYTNTVSLTHYYEAFVIRQDPSQTLLNVEEQGSEGRVLQGVQIIERASGGVLKTSVGGNCSHTVCLYSLAVSM